MKKILVVSHCILNTSSKVQQDESELEEEYKLRAQLLRLSLKYNIQLLQLPCPELLLYGSRRWGHVCNQFDNPFFVENCKQIFRPILLQLKEYNKYPDEFQILGIVSVEGSPSCGYGLTWFSSEWGGHPTPEKLSSAKVIEESGVFMRTIHEILNEEALSVPILNLQSAISLIRKIKS